MTISATITSKGQVTIPKSIRDLLDLAKNDLLVFTVKKSKEVVVTPIKTDIMSLYGSLKTNKGYIPLSKIRKQLQHDLGKEYQKES
ncbi:MAG: AbrB/MazE/SpoVT family DNA-binding domain-containing protein [Candidatus Beckwithbacteria bacterium]|nr:type II toxin-antitoxin system PrlF family antitoxin [Patescibacteria group bacterium]